MKKTNQLTSFLFTPVFDPNTPMDIKNPDHLKLHADYKNLVDYMLGSFMDEMQITPDKFEQACLEGRNQQQQGDNLRAFHHRLFQQIWAANDIRIFVRMMTQRNVELQLQALDLIERRANSRDSTTTEVDYPVAVGEAAESFGGVEEGKAFVVPEDTETDLIEFNEQGGDDALMETNAEELLDSLQNDQVDDEPTTTTGEGVEEKHLESTGTPHPPTTLPKLEHAKAMSDKFERLHLFFEKERVDEVEVRQRQDYLRAQRDKILEIKKRTRARQLNETVRTAKRPTSARAAQKILAGEQLPENSADPGESSLVLRRALAKRLRDEVVDGKEKRDL